MVIFYYFSSNKFKRLSNDEFLYDVYSSNLEYKLNVYLSYGGSISGDSIRVQLKDLNNGKVKNIYWNYPCSDVNIIWIDEKTVQINDITINIHNDTYYNYG